MTGSGALSASADYVATTGQYVRNTIYSQWSGGGTDELTYSFITQITDITYPPYTLTFSNAFDDGDQIEKRVIVEYAENGNRLFDTGYVLGDINNMTIPYNGFGDMRVRAYVRRTDGGQIDQYNWSGGSFAITYGMMTYETDIPPSWLETTTVSGVFIPLETVTTPVDEDTIYNDLYEGLNFLSQFSAFVQWLLWYLSQWLSLRYVTGIVVFNIYLGTLVWVVENA